MPRESIGRSELFPNEYHWTDLKADPLDWVDAGWGA
jgi:hypothetical protein